ncbi:small acid-soluble spore protein Tlp [Bacillus pumilus]|jgi:small acid-soluble spore protein (thioredoxin-like protein)|uniref:Small, acid-soluble spore protein Tlp n=5 Tax=Bacillus TaxID=1386 RepID=A0A5K1N568_BACAB|nr:small acid-soluble spore protein Tlp [Bacillus altitudinis]AMM89108.1 small acid-soluble spore protein Tlp [Bacillus pumilus]EIL85606.1 small acid-soluble spore protein Tlp [Bacillus sp. M 2-6]KKK09241.1 small acid-soluble spore protein Tlp [Bacillus sp. L_1B0_12]KML18454.1 small acid-soluble spore protein Tlp [Bacillus stratosphericus]KMN70215.1 small acid-soluble spore protein Tlp [Bacillus sp. LK10]KQL39613.1 small acid-soluble spore protein Tlp [Bacillus sp. FJAT-21955]KQU14853.1 smal
MMNDKSYQSNPDDRSDNVEKLQDMIENTLENIDESEAAMGLSTEEEKQMIKQKNENRRTSIDAMRSEIKDEEAARKSGYTE